jgi:hypothetical protein
MTEQFCLSLAVRRSRSLLIMSIFALGILPSLVEAQDVMALPGGSPATSATVFDAPTPPSAQADNTAASTPDTAVVPQLVRQPATPPSATTAVAPSVTTTASDAKYRQCATDADCVRMGDGCKTLSVANQRYVADGSAGMAHDAACRPAAASPLSIQAVCRNGMCGLLPGRIP